MPVFTGPIKVPFLGWRKQREQTFTNARINHLKEAIMWLLGKTALITAAGQEIGRACALAMAEQGATTNQTLPNPLGLLLSALIQCLFKLCQFLSNSRVFFRLGFVVYPLEGGFF
jgi:hypothetical protein